MKHVLLDSSIYIAALRGEDAALRLEKITAGTVLWLSAVVLEELYAGAGARDRDAVEQLERGFGKAGRILVPDLNDWVQAGRVLARLAIKYDYEKIGRGRLTNDALIATCAARMGIRVITANEKDFRKLAEFSSFPWQFSSL
ncbi:MAG: type II toxin-antitoxin system VapC family toxin [Candidatus Sulfotelmatobacter sp.]